MRFKKLFTQACYHLLSSFPIRRQRSWLLVLPIVLSLVSFSSTALADNQGNAYGRQDTLDTRVTEELIVKFQPGFGRQNQEAALARVAVKTHHLQDRNIRPRGRRGLSIFDQLVHVKLKPDLDQDQAIADLMRNPNVEYAEPNFIVNTLESLPNDPDFSLLWGLQNNGQTGGTAGADIDAPAAWDIATGSAQVVVAVIDTGIDYEHSDLAPNMWVNSDEIPGNGIDDDGNGFVDDVHGYDFYNNDADPRDDHFHGTHCAGTIGAAGNNGKGIAGINWTVRLMALKFLGASGMGTSDAAIRAIQYAINNGAHVMSNSWGGSGYSQALQDVILEAHSAGIVFVAAAGNNGSSSKVYPAAHDKVIAVSATDHNDTKASFSSYGTFIDVAAPGVNIFSTKLNDTYGYASGTSMACPHVAGLAALLKSQDITLSPDQIENILETTADDLGNPGWDTYYGPGRIDANRALQAVVQKQTVFPTARISSPTENLIVSGMNLDILGTAAGNGFQDYSVAYAAAGNGTWNTIKSAATPVTNGTLATWDFTTLPDGDYLILLTVTDAWNRQIHDAVTVTLERFAAVISSPTQFVVPGSTEITGTAETKNGMPFEAYTLEWGVGSSPASFSSAGISLVDNGQQPINNGKLATWDTSALVDGQTYTLRLTVFSSLGVQYETSVKIRPDTGLVAGWPKLLSASSNQYVIPTAADLDGNGTMEVIVAGPDDQIRVFNKDGSPFPGFPVSLKQEDYYRFGVNVDDLDADGTLEIIAVASNFTSTLLSRLVVLKHDGTPYPGWSPPSFVLAVNSSDLTPSVADLNGDGSKELIVLEKIRMVTKTDVKLHAFDLSGAELAGFPKKYDLPPSTYDVDSEMYASNHGVVSIADLDGDGHPEIAWGYSNRIYLFDHQGNVLPGWPFIAPDYNGKIMLFESAAASGDIDGDGQLELFAVGRGYNCGGCETQLYAWRKDGSVLAGWPKTDESDDIVLWNISSVQNTPVLVDFDADGKDEVVVGLDNIAIFGDGGRLPFTSVVDSTDIQPSPGDVDGDGKLEFLAYWYNTITIVDDDGSYYWKRSLFSYPVRKMPGIFADLDNDGTMELMMTFADGAPSVSLYVWEIPRTGPGPAAGQWPMFNHDAARSGRQGAKAPVPPDDGVAPVSAITAPADGSAVSGIVAVAVDASDNVGVARVELYADEVLIGTDTAEPYLIEWDTQTVSNGSHILMSTAYDAAGNAGPSPAVTVVVENDTTPPSPPPLVLPEDGIVSSNPTPMFGWLDVGDSSGVSYRLQVDNNTDFSSPEIDAGDLTSANYTPAQALSDDTYSWRVLAVDGAGNASAWSEVRTLTIDTQPQSCSPAVPAVSILPADQSAAAGTGLNYAVSVTNTDQVSCEATTFSLNRTIPGGWTGTLSAGTMTLAPGQTGQATLVVTSADSAVPGTYGVAVSVSDLAGSVHDGSGQASYTVVEPQGDNESPSDPTALSADLKLKQVNLSWNGATDNLGVAGYQILRNGTAIGETTGTNYIDREISADESYAYQVVAYDAAGNTSGPSNSVSVTYGGKVNPGRGPKK